MNDILARLKRMKAPPLIDLSQELKLTISLYKLMKAIMTFLQGKKTYLISLSAIVGAVTAVATGEASVMEAAQIITTALLGTTVRAGISK